MKNKVKARLAELAEADYKAFNEKLTPGATNVLGVRIPRLREIAKEAARQDWRTYLAEADDTTFEEIMIQGMVIGYAKMELTERFACLNRFIPKIDNWSVCDSCCMTYKFMKKDQEQVWEFLMPHLNSGQEFPIRFTVVAMLDHFINDDYIGRILDCFNQICHEGYYVKMAVAWAVATCFAKYPEQTLEFLKENDMDAFTQNKAIQKSCESYRVSDEMKAAARLLKR